MALIYRGGGWPSPPQQNAGLPADRLAIQNWRNAGMISKGGVVSGTYHRTTVFATVNPIGAQSTFTASLTAGSANLVVTSLTSGAIAVGQTVVDSSSNAVGVIASGSGLSWTLSFPAGNGAASQTMTGRADDTSAIQTQLNACTAGQVVMLGSGLFIVGSVGGGSAVFIPSNVTLRGSGAGVTKLLKPNGGWLRTATVESGTNGILAPPASNPSYDNFPIIYVSPSLFPQVDESTAQLLTADAAQGDMSITVANASAFATGTFVILDEFSGASWQPAPTGFGNSDSQSFAISSGTYNNGTGIVSLSLASAAAAYAGDPIEVSALTGTGAFASLDGTFAVVSGGTPGSPTTTVTYNAGAGHGAATITGGNLIVGPPNPLVWQGDKAVWNVHYPLQLFQDDAQNTDSNAPYDTGGPLPFNITSIVGNTMTTTGSPALVPGMRFFGPGVAPLSSIISGAANTFTIIPAQNIGAIAATGYVNTLGTYGFFRTDRPICEMKEIASVVGNVVTFTSPVMINYRISHGAELTAFTNAGGHTSQPFTQYAGIEELTLAGGGNGNIRFVCAAYCWARNVEATQWINENFDMTLCFRIEIRDSYSHTASGPTPCGGGYSFSQSDATSECLFENNIILDANKMMVARSCGAGSVAGYNYADNGWISFNVTYVEIGMNGSHLLGSHHMLFEGNICFNADSDYTHGNAIYMTHWRGWYTGQRRDFTDSGQLRTAGTSPYGWWHSFVGNVLGYASKPSWISSFGLASTTAATSYVITDPAMNCDVNGANCIGGLATWGNEDIWIVGLDPERRGGVPEAVALSTIIRTGNYDFCSGAQHFYDTPGGVTIPNSLYLTGAPWFFSTPASAAWPIANPSTGSPGSSITNPALIRYNAGTPNVPGI